MIKIHRLFCKFKPIHIHTDTDAYFNTNLQTYSRDGLIRRENIFSVRNSFSQTCLKWVMSFWKWLQTTNAVTNNFWTGYWSIGYLSSSILHIRRQHFDMLEAK